MEVWIPVIVVLVSTMISPAAAKVAGVMWQKKFQAKEAVVSDLTKEAEEKNAEAARAQMRVLIMEERLQSCYRQVDRYRQELDKEREERKT